MLWGCNSMAHVKHLAHALMCSIISWSLCDSCYLHYYKHIWKFWCSPPGMWRVWCAAWKPAHLPLLTKTIPIPLCKCVCVQTLNWSVLNLTVLAIRLQFLWLFKKILAYQQNREARLLPNLAKQSDSWTSPTLVISVFNLFHLRHHPGNWVTTGLDGGKSDPTGRNSRVLLETCHTLCSWQISLFPSTPTICGTWIGLSHLPCPQKFCFFFLRFLKVSINSILDLNIKLTSFLF